MGNRAEVLVTEGKEGVYLYTHWGRDELVESVRAGLLTAHQGGRLTDASYLTRILFCHIVPQEELYEQTGFGIWSSRTEGDLIEIDVKHQTIESEDFGIPLQSLMDFIYNNNEETDNDDDGDEDDPAY